MFQIFNVYIYLREKNYIYLVNIVRFRTMVTYLPEHFKSYLCKFIHSDRLPAQWSGTVLELHSK